MEVTEFGPNALLLRFAEQADEPAFHLGRALVAGIERGPPTGLREVVPAFTTLLLVFDPGQPRPAAEELLGFLREPSVYGSPLDDRSPIEIPVHYSGSDLPKVAENAMLAVDDVITLHCTPTYRVCCLGFAPGFPYLGGLDPRLHTPRLATPRPRVPAGSVAIGGGHTGIYSVPSPGGWNLVGTTPTALFDPSAASLDDMFRLRPGDRVRLMQMRGTRDGRVEGLPAKRPSQVRPSAPSIRILDTGLGLTLQDMGRPGFARFGVPPGGALDPFAAGWANRLLDNSPGAPVLELCLQGQRLEILRDGWMAVTGNAGGRPARFPSWSAFRVRAGDLLEFPAGGVGVWSYLAIPGGFMAESVLGSASTNPRAGFGAVFQVGDELGSTDDAEQLFPAALAGRKVSWTEVPSWRPETPLRVWRGPQWDGFNNSDRERFFGTEWTVSSQCDRVGYRLNGPVLRPEPSEIISEPVLPGSVQVPANGQPIVTMPDGPTLGGYPKVGLVEPADLPRLAQCRPGARVRFILIGC